MYSLRLVEKKKFKIAIPDIFVDGIVFYMELIIDFENFEKKSFQVTYNINGVWGLFGCDRTSIEIEKDKKFIF